MIAGIAADNYKLDKFKKELQDKNFTIHKIVPFVDDTSVIKVELSPDRVDELRKLCELLEIHFKRSN